MQDPRDKRFYQLQKREKSQLSAVEVQELIKYCEAMISFVDNKKGRKNWVLFKQELDQLRDKPRFTWGNSVSVSVDAEQCYRPGEFGSVCGITCVDNDELAKNLQVPRGSYSYTIEFGDGTDALIPDKYLSSSD